MEEPTPSLDQWRRLYALAADVKALAPWNWMGEGDLFAVEDPDSEQLGFVSVMGAIGEHFAVAVYRGGAGLRGFLAMQDAGKDDFGDLFFATPHLHASFEDRDMLYPEDRELIKTLGLKFRGRNVWPLFRSYRPGYAPWYLTAQEASFLTLMMEQTLDVAPRFRDDKSLFYGDDKGGMLVRAASFTDEGAVWEDRRQSELPLDMETVALEIDTWMLDRLRALRPGKESPEIDLFMLPAPIREGKGRPYFAYNLLFVEGKSGYILGFELLHVETTLEAMWAKVPELVLRRLLSSNMKPAAIKTRPGLVQGFLQPIADYCGIPLRQSARLPMLDEARESLLRRMF